MIKQKIQQTERRLILLLTLRFLLLITLLLLISLFLFNVFYSIPLFIIALSVVPIVFIFAILYLIRRYRSEIKNILPDMEHALYGKRLLKVDSVREFSKTGIESEIVRLTELSIKSNPKWNDYLRDKRARFIKRLSILIFSIIGAVVLSLFLYPGVVSKKNDIHNFYHNEYELDIPVYYIESADLEIDLSDLNTEFDRLYLSLSNQNIENEHFVYILSEAVTSAPEIDIEVVAMKFGLKRSLYENTMVSTSKMLPNKMNMTVIYPFGREEYRGLQDLEMWSGGRLEISGNFTKDIEKIESDNDISLATEIDGRYFGMSFYPWGDRQYNLSFTAEDGDTFNSPGFTVKTVENTPPTIKIIYPLKDIMIDYYEWIVNAIVESEDEQGVDTIYCDITITNRDPYLSYTHQESYEIDGQGERYVKDSLKLTYLDLMILPNDCASVEFYSIDVFGSQSEIVKFHIISPDLLDIQMEREELTDQFYQQASDLTNELAELEEDIENENLAGAAQASSEVASQVEALQSTMDALSENLSQDMSSIEDIRTAVETMQSLTEMLSEKSDILESMTEMLQNEELEFEDIDLSQLGMDEILEELQSLMRSMEYYEEYSDMVNQYHVLENAYETLKQIEDEEAFDRAMESYQSELENMGEADNEEVSSLTESLMTESENIEMGESDSYESSDELMEELKEQIDDQIGMAAQNRMQDTIDEIEEIINELFLNQFILRETLALDVGVNDNPVLSNITIMVQNLNSVNSSLKELESSIETALEGYVFGEPTINGETNASAENSPKQNISELIESAWIIMDYAMAGLRDNDVYQAESWINYLMNNFSVISLYLIKINSAIETAMNNMSQAGQPQADLKSMSMGDLMMMQSMMSQALEQLLQQMQQEGGASPEAQQLMDDLADLQKQIQEGLQEILSNTSEGAVTGGSEMSELMDQIIEDLESYNVEQDTLEISQELEQRLLESTRSLDSTGVNDDRQSESASVYEAAPPESNILEMNETYDLSELGSPDLSDYYQKLIDTYLSE